MNLLHLCGLGLACMWLVACTPKQSVQKNAYNACQNQAVPRVAPADGVAHRVGRPDAPEGCSLYVAMKTEPETLNPISSSDMAATEVQAYVMEGLLHLNIDTYEHEPKLAYKWEAAPDNLSYTFYLRKNIKWHDGQPLTAHDVKFSFDAIRDPQYKAIHSQPYFENIGECVVLDDYTVKFTIKKTYFNNFNVLASAGFFPIVPKHYYEDVSKKRNKTIMGSGPYKLAKYNKGQSIVLEKNPDWWGREVPHLKGFWKPQRVVLRFIKEDQVRLEALKKQSIDYSLLKPEDFVKKTSGPLWESGQLVKQKVSNQGPKSYGFVGWNLKNPLFQEVRVRRALAQLMNRREMNKKFRYDMSLLATGPWYRQSPYAAPGVKPLEFDPKKAAQLLAQAGWRDTDKNGILDKEIDGKKTDFKFSLMYANKDSEKYYTTYKQDLKKAGIEVELKLLDWASFLKSLDDKKFEAVSLGWGGGSVDNDPKQIWHSQSAQKGGSNFISYANPEVDALIDKGRAELDKQKRIQIYQQIYKKIADDAPYAWMFVKQFDLYAHRKRIKYDKPTYKFYVGEAAWWIEAN